MKIYSSNLVNIIDIVVNFDVYTDYTESDLSVAADSNIPDNYTEKFKESEEFHRFEEFLINVLGVLDVNDFIIEDHHWSNRRNSLSYYISFYPTDAEGNVLDKYIINLRISTHWIKDSYNRYLQYNKSVAKKYKRSSGRYQKFLFKSVVVRGNEMPDYAQAVEYLYSIADKLSEGNYNI